MLQCDMPWCILNTSEAFMAMCVKNSSLAITVCKSYEILDTCSSGKVKIFDDNGHVVWVSSDCFRL